MMLSMLLMLFALIAGAGTALSPCVLPVLPAVLSAGATGGRRRPLGVVCGLVVTYTIAIVALASVVKGVGVAGGLARTLAIVALLAFGIALAVPALGARLEAPLQRLSRFGPRSAGHGFWSGTVVGGALGFVYAPCAGPILGAVIAVSASRGTSAQLVLVGLSYGIGSGIVLLALSLGGRRLLERVRRAGRGAGLQRALGAVLVLTAAAMALNLDTRFQTALAGHFPSALVNPTRAIEDSGVVSSRLARLRGRARFDSARAVADHSGGVSGTGAPRLPDLGAAPDFTGTQRWFNTPGGRPLSLARLRGRVVLVDFWTYTCINCIRTFPFLKTLDARYRRDGLTIVGVHTPEFTFEHRAANVASAIAQNGLRYAVAQDNDYATWNAYGNQYWPADYLIDADGRVRHTTFGEGGYAETEAAVRELLREAGAKRLGASAHARGVPVGTRLATPETYLGAARAERFVPGPPRPGVHAYRAPSTELPASHFALAGTWRIGPQAATAVRGAAVHATVTARAVYLVLSSAGGRPRSVGVELDGRPVTAREAGPDVHAGVATVRGQRLYRLVSLPRPATRRLTLHLAPGVSAYAFTFG